MTNKLQSTMKKTLFFLFMFYPLVNHAIIPKYPDSTLTPGSLCAHPDGHRYAENIPYCSRNVSKELKQIVIDKYTQKYRFGISNKNRSSFKIDHYIPLCMGGSNNMDNLWPQHISIYQITDLLEQQLCERMALGTMTQEEAITTMKRAKNDLTEAQQLVNFFSKK